MLGHPIHPYIENVPNNVVNIPRNANRFSNEIRSDAMPKVSDRYYAALFSILQSDSIKHDTTTESTNISWHISHWHHSSSDEAVNF